MISEQTAPLDKLPVVLKAGTEQLGSTGKTLSDFWRWSASDLVSNATRGVLAEFIVAEALGIDLSVPRDEWAAWDLTSPEGIRIEVKSAAYLQSWKQQQLSRIIFSIRPARSWNGKSGGMNETPGCSADAYVFCLLKHQDKETLNPLDLKQWEFYVLSTTELNTYARNGTSITLASVQKLTDEIPFEKLRNAVWKKGKP